MKLVLASLMVVLLAGCGTLVPKKVELLQDKVQKFPDKTASDREIQREVAQAASRKAQELVKSVLTNAPATNILKQAEDASALLDALSTSLGPPISPSKSKPETLADKLESATGKFIERVTSFKETNDENAGKKIEGTGLVRVNYFVWVGGIAALGFVIFTLLKILGQVGAAANPAVGLGMNVVSMGSKTIARAFGQVVKGGRNFLKKVDEIVPDEALRDALKEAFVAEHKQAQDGDVQDAVKKLIKE